jgi:hypothetical protein
MELEKKFLVVWLDDAAAKAFLGLEGDRPISRWAFLGRCLGDSHRHLWIEIDHIEERRPKDSNLQFVTWTVKPPICSIHWEWVITVQVLDERPDDTKEIGFTSKIIER